APPAFVAGLLDPSSAPPPHLSCLCGALLLHRRDTKDAEGWCFESCSCLVMSLLALRVSTDCLPLKSSPSRSRWIPSRSPLGTRQFLAAQRPTPIGSAANGPLANRWLAHHRLPLRAADPRTRLGRRVPG